LILLEKYAHDFKTSGVKVHSSGGGHWNWTSSNQPLLFRNWGLEVYSNFFKDQLLISKESPFVWFNHNITNEKELFSDYFICESSAPQQEIKHLKANANAKVRDPDTVILISSK
jgi:hypothetical protein